MVIQSILPDLTKKEYGVIMRRVYQVNAPPFYTPFGSAWAFIKPGEQSDPHSHHEDETFYITKGNGLMIIDDENQAVVEGDTIYIPAHANHILKNTGTEDLVFVTIWWEPSKNKQVEVID